MNEQTFGISVGFSRLSDIDDLCAYIHIANCGSVTISSGLARQIGTQLIMLAEYIENKTDE